ncbi:MAG: hypothetical protein SGCHY_003134 [Lobulomycetales sp.]
MSPPFQRGKLPETSQWQIEHQKKLLLFFENQKKAKAEIAPQAGPAVEEDEDNEEEEDDEDDPRPAVTSIPKGVLYYAKFAQEKGWIENVRDFQEELFPLDKHQFHEYLDFHAGPESKIRSRGTFHLYMTHILAAEKKDNPDGGIFNATETLAKLDHIFAILDGDIPRPLPDDLAARVPTLPSKLSQVLKGVQSYAKFAKDQGWIEDLLEYKVLFPLDAPRLHAFLEYICTDEECVIRSKRTFNLYINHIAAYEKKFHCDGGLVVAPDTARKMQLVRDILGGDKPRSAWNKDREFPSPKAAHKRTDTEVDEMEYETSDKFSDDEEGDYERAFDDFTDEEEESVLEISKKREKSGTSEARTYTQSPTARVDQSSGSTTSSRASSKKSEQNVPIETSHSRNHGKQAANIHEAEEPIYRLKRARKTHTRIPNAIIMEPTAQANSKNPCGIYPSSSASRVKSTATSASSRKQEERKTTMVGKVPDIPVMAMHLEEITTLSDESLRERLAASERQRYMLSAMVEILKQGGNVDEVKELVNLL